jgi:hypothetical protein
VDDCVLGADTASFLWQVSEDELQIIAPTDVLTIAKAKDKTVELIGYEGQFYLSSIWWAGYKRVRVSFQKNHVVFEWWIELPYVPESKRGIT